MSIFSEVCTTNLSLVQRALEIANNYKTVYMKGGIGGKVTSSYINSLAKLYPSWYTEAKKADLNKYTSETTFGFDCVCLVKSILWGWKGLASKSYGGAVYQSNDVPDISEDSMITKCSDVSTDFSKIETGELVWMKGHVGIYVGNGLAVECTNRTGWKNGVQVTACNRDVHGYNRRDWTKHGKLPYITYICEESDEIISFSELDVVKVKEGVTKFSNGSLMANFVKTSKLYVRGISGDKITISTLKEGAVTGTVFAKDLVLVEKAVVAQPETTPETCPETSDTSTNTKVEDVTNNQPTAEPTVPETDVQKDTTPESTEQTTTNEEETVVETDSSFWKNLIQTILEFITKLFKKQ